MLRLASAACHLLLHTQQITRAGVTQRPQSYGHEDAGTTRPMRMPKVRRALAATQENPNQQNIASADSPWRQLNHPGHI